MTIREFLYGRENFVSKQNTNDISKAIRFTGLMFVVCFGSLFVLHVLVAFRDYHEGKLTVNVEDLSHSYTKRSINGIEFKNLNYGEIIIKPTLVQSIVLENDILKDTGLIYFLLGLIGVGLIAISKKSFEYISGITHSDISSGILYVFIFYIVCKFAIFWLLSSYVLEVTHNAFAYHAEEGNYIFLFFGVTYSSALIFKLLVYGRKLKQENDLTI